MKQQTILEAIAQGFQKNTEEYILQISIIIGLFILMILSSILFNILFRKKRYRIWEQEYEDMIRKYDLTINEIDFIDELTPFLVDQKRKTLILKNLNTYLNALALWKKKNPAEDLYSDRLMKKLFGKDSKDLQNQKTSLYGPGRPARYIDPEGRTFSGVIASTDTHSMTLKNVIEMDIREKSGRGQLFIQDYKGIISKPVSSFKILEKASLLVNIGEIPLEKKVSLSDIYILLPGKEKPVKTTLIKLEKGTGIILAPDMKLGLGQALKLSFRVDLDTSFNVNALITGISLNKRYIRLKFGYLKRAEKSKKKYR